MMSGILEKTDIDDSTEKTKENLHDAELVVVSIDRVNAVVRLAFRLENASHYTLELQALKAFRCEDLSLQNVVSRVLQSVDEQLSSAELDYWINWVTSLSDASSWLSEQQKRDWLRDIGEKIINLIVFEPSAGATLAVICNPCRE